MLQLIHGDLEQWQHLVRQAKSDQMTAVADALLLSQYIGYLSRFPLDERQRFVVHWQQTMLSKSLPCRADVRLLDFILDRKGYWTMKKSVGKFDLFCSRIERILVEGRNIVDHR